MRLTQEQRDTAYRRDVSFPGRPLLQLYDGDSFRMHTGDDRTVLLVHNFAGRLAVLEIDHGELPSAVELR